MRILITGSSGFIGNALARRLVEAGHEIVPMDKRATGRANGDVTSEQDCRRFCQDIDVVVHGAAIHHAQQVRQNPDATMSINVGGARALLDASVAAGVRRFVYLSTAKVYGEPLELPSRETDPLRPQDPYAISKLATEEHCREYHARHGLEMAILRPFSVYGPGQDLDTGYIGMLLAGLRNGVSPILPGQPDFLRDFVHIDDLVALLTACVTRPLPDLTIVNAASGRARTLASLVNEFSRLAGHGVGARYGDPAADTIRHSCGDPTQAQRLFGLVPRVSLSDGLASCLQWRLGEDDARLGKFLVIGLIMLAAGRSQRFATDGALKQFADIHGKPVLVRALMPYLEHGLADAIVLVVPREHQQRCQALLDACGIGHRVALTQGGATRQLSIRAGLAALDAWAGERRFDTLILHNAASPNADVTTIRRCIAGLADAPVVQACQPELRTQFLASEGFATQMLPRDQIVCSADPTVFRAAALRDVLRYQQDQQITADTTTDVALALGLRVGLVESGPGNIKITAPFDLAAVSAAIAQEDPVA